MSRLSVNLLLLLVSALPLACVQDSKEKTIRIEETTLVTEPGSLPASFPEFARYPSGTIRITGSCCSSSEGAALIHTDDATDKIERYYLTAFQKYGWNIIQSYKKKGELLIMAESPLKPLLTVIVRDENPAQIRLLATPKTGN